MLITSYYFYFSWNPKYAIWIMATTLTTYVSGLLLDGKLQAKKRAINRKIILSVCIIFNMSVLGIFKYMDFLFDSVNSVLSVFNVTVIDRQFDLLLPIGISFYTFQAVGYLIDVYRKEIDAEKNPVRYALFVSFFPLILSGPIERSKNLLVQMRSMQMAKLWDLKRMTRGAIYMVWGYFMKMVIADRIAILVDTVFNNYRTYGSTELILAAAGFAIQIYCDFCSCSYLAIGAAKMMGFEIIENFNAPFFSNSIKEFWRRWHISLSSWFRDYLYVPLGGNRKGEWIKNRNLMIVFLVSGLWHGASWNYIVWGGIHGIYLILENILMPHRKRLEEKMKVRTDCFSWSLLQKLVTFSLFVFSLIFFKTETLMDALRYLKRILVNPTPWALWDGSLYELGLVSMEINILLIALVMLFLVDFIRYAKKITIDEFLLSQNLWFEWLVIIVWILMIFVFGEYGPAYDPKQFIYFKF